MSKLTNEQNIQNDGNVKEINILLKDIPKIEQKGDKFFLIKKNGKQTAKKDGKPTIKWNNIIVHSGEILINFDETKFPSNDLNIDEVKSNILKVLEKCVIEYNDAFVVTYASVKKANLKRFFEIRINNSDVSNDKIMFYLNRELEVYGKGIYYESDNSKVENRKDLVKRDLIKFFKQKGIRASQTTYVIDENISVFSLSFYDAKDFSIEMKNGKANIQYYSPRISNEPKEKIIENPKIIVECDITNGNLHIEITNLKNTNDSFITNYSSDIIANFNIESFNYTWLGDSNKKPTKDITQKQIEFSDNSKKPKKKSTKKKTSTKELSFEDWSKKAFKELKEEQDIQDAKIIESNESEGSIRIENGDQEWLVFQNYEKAEAKAIELVKSDLESEPELFSIDWLKDYLTISDSDKETMASEESETLWEESIKIDQIEKVAKDFDYTNEYEHFIDDVDLDELEISEKDLKVKSEEELYEKLEELWKKDFKSKMIDELSDPYQYFVKDEGIYKLEDLLKQSFISIDIDKASKDAIDTDGVAHFIAPYDFEDVEMKNGIAYRQNDGNKKSISKTKKKKTTNKKSSIKKSSAKSKDGVCVKGKIHKSLCIGDKIKLTQEALDNYGEKFNRTYTIENMTNDVKANGYDASLSPEYLISCKELDFSIYEYEFEVIKPIKPKSDSIHQYKSLNEIYPKGTTEIWYSKPSEDLNKDFLLYGKSKSLELPKNYEDLSKTHVLLGSVKETNLDKIYNNMQGEIWSPNGQAWELIEALKLDHTSMSVGDIIVLNKKEAYICASSGFDKLF